LHKHEFRFDNPNSAPYPATDSCECGVYRDYAPNHHPYRLIEIDGRLEKIDEGMADLVQELLDAGVRTGHCCQGGCMDFPNVDYSAPKESILPLIEKMADSPLHPGYITFHNDDRQIAMPIITNRLTILDEQPSVTWRKSFDGNATSIHFKARVCQICNEALLSLLS
jgi:hypothetical protein